MGVYKALETHVLFNFFIKACLYAFSPIMTHGKKKFNLGLLFLLQYIYQICPNALAFSESSLSKIKSNMYLTFKSRYRGKKVWVYVEHNLCYGRKDKDISLHV